MIVTCPNCETHFTIPDGAIGPKGRKLRCSRCGQTWLIEPPATAEDFLLDQPSQPDFAAPESETPAPSSPDDGGIKVDAPEEENQAEKSPEEDPFAHIADLMMKSTPDPIPDIFSAPVPVRSRRKGGIGLWLLFIILLIGAAAVCLYAFQDSVIAYVPQAGHYYEELGLRHKVVGAGLAFRNIDSERVMQNDSEVLIVRGVIANTTDRPRDIPPLRLALYNNERTLQEKIIQPPQPGLEAQASVGFRVTLERPDPVATRFEVTFSAPADQASPVR